MPPSEVSTSKTKSTVFLAEPSGIPELDDWIADYIGRGERFTFDETQVLMSLWQGGEDVRLREDKRFRQVPFSLQGREPQWYLAMHILANQQLYELLLDELWDGRDLYRCLEECDKGKENVYHVFCTTMHLLETLRQTSSASDALQDIRPDILENWLLHQSEWVRVGRDSWLPKSKIPDIP